MVSIMGAQCGVLWTSEQVDAQVSLMYARFGADTAGVGEGVCSACGFPSVSDCSSCIQAISKWWVRGKVVAAR